MIGELQKYRAYTLQITGFALMTPFGRFCLKLIENENYVFSFRTILILSFCSLLLYFGIICVLRGQIHLGGKLK